MEAQSIYNLTTKQFSRTLGNLKKFLDKFQTFAETKKFEPTNVLNARLAPDQFHFIRQIQIATDTAKFCCSRLAGKEVPSFDDKEQTLDDLRTRIDKTISYLKTYSAKDFEGASQRKIPMPRREGKVMTGENYLNEFGIPNFYFHVTTAYAILRHNGVDLGKDDFLGDIALENA